MSDQTKELHEALVPTLIPDWAQDKCGGHSSDPTMNQDPVNPVKARWYMENQTFTKFSLDPMSGLALEGREDNHEL